MQRREFIRVMTLTGGCIALGVSPFTRGQELKRTETSLPDLVRTGMSLRLTAIDVALDRHTAIWADTVTIIGAIRTGGYGLTIVAREILFESSGSIDTRGKEAVPDYPGDTRASDGRSAGDQGQDGGSGGAGASAGNVLLVAHTILGNVVIIAAGRSGGAAQNGGNGAKGQQASAQSLDCQPGIQGGRGGRAGSAGAPGAGGAGGHVKVYADQIKNGKGAIDVSGGLPGSTAKHGKPGPGGDGGAGGKDVWRHERGQRH